MDPDAIHDLTPAYALDALDAREREAYERHLARCGDCQEELASFQRVATALAYAPEAPAPPAALRGRILEAARAERPNVVPLRQRLFVPVSTAAAVAAVAALALGLWGVSLSRDLDGERAAARDARQALALVARPDSQRVRLSGADGVVAVAPSGRAALVFASLRKPPAGKAYEAWVIAGGEATPAGVFDGRTHVLERTVRPGDTVAVTIERAAGVQEPTTEPFAAARV
jgi:anti-sigma factor RsiW